MKQEVIHDFLNVPGIVGVALMDGSSRPYFHGFGDNVNFFQQDALAQSIQQVLETTPEGFNSFEFQFDLYRVYLHKLNQGVTLLVLTGKQLPRLAYTQAIRRLLIELQFDQSNVVNSINEFRSLATSFSQASPQAASQATQGSPQVSPPSPSPVLSKPSAILEQFLEPEPASSEPSELEPVESELAEVEPATPVPLQLVEPPTVFSATSQNANVKDVLAAINALSQLTSRYLGTMVVANYWKSTRPAADWLNHFQIERSGQMTFVVQIPSERLPTLTSEQLQSLQAWVAAFVTRCSKIIRDFAKIVQQSLNEHYLALLFDSSS